MREFLDWGQSYGAGSQACGGKGYNLARLARYGFQVPAGGVLPAGASLAAIRPGLERLGLADARLAVRSSATAEDSAGASFAGIHRSFLDVSGPAAVEEAAQGCIDSLQSPQAIAYRRRMGIADEAVRCAVVICEMVSARAAGVAFSCEPATGRRDLIVIEAAQGLGETVVAGHMNPRRSVWQNRQGRLVRQEGEASCPWLPAPVEEDLAHQVWRAQWGLGDGQNPQDVEWAYDGARLWILQARPVTRVPWPGWAEAAALPRYWSTANLKDNQPGVGSECSWSTLDEIVGDAAYASMSAVGYPMPPGMQIVRRFHGRGFFDLTIMQWAFYDAFGVPPGDVARLIGGRQPEIPVPPRPFRGSAGRRRLLANLRFLRLIWNHPRRAQTAIERQLRYQRSLEGVDWTGYSLDGLFDALEKLAAAQIDFLPVAGLANGSYGPWQRALDGLVEDDGLIARLQTGTGAVASAEHGYRLYDVACGRSTLEEFLRDFGHRGVFETDIANPRWVEDPSWVLEQVEAIRRNPPERDPRQVAAEIRRGAEEELRRRFGWRTPLLLWLVRKLCQAMAAREGAKSAMVALALPLRRIVLEIGRRLAAAGRLDTPEQTTDLAHADLTCLLRGYWDGAGARELVCDRALRRKRWMAEPCPDLITEEPDGSMSAAAPPSGAPGTGWTGIPVSPGSACGLTRIIRTPGDAARLEPGDILVAPSTDPGWTPLFLRAAAIVMETGGYLSHGAIVAREYGIPAVANVPGILEALADGEPVLVDGTSGRVLRRLSAAD